MPADRGRCLQAGMDDFVTKPVHVEDLVRVIEEADIRRAARVARPAAASVQEALPLDVPSTGEGYVKLQETALA